MFQAEIRKIVERETHSFGFEVDSVGLDVERDGTEERGSEEETSGGGCSSHCHWTIFIF